MFFALGDATAEKEHDEAVRECAEFEGDLYCVVGFQFAGAHRLLEDIYGGIEGRGAAGFEVPGIDACALARNEEHEFVEVGGLQSSVEEDFADLHEAVLDVALEVNGLELGCEVVEARVGDGVEQAVAVGKVAIDGHGGDTDLFGDGTHGDGGDAFAVKEVARGGEDGSGCSWRGRDGFG